MAVYLFTKDMKVSVVQVGYGMAILVLRHRHSGVLVNGKGYP